MFSVDLLCLLDRQKGRLVLFSMTEESYFSFQDPSRPNRQRHNRPCKRRNPLWRQLPNSAHLSNRRRIYNKITITFYGEIACTAWRWILSVCILASSWQLRRSGQAATEVVWRFPSTMKSASGQLLLFHRKTFVPAAAFLCFLLSGTSIQMFYEIGVSRKMLKLLQIQLFERWDSRFYSIQWQFVHITQNMC